MSSSLNLDKLLRDFHKEEPENYDVPGIRRTGNHFADCRKAAWQLTAPRWRTSHNLCEWIEGSSQKAVTDLMEEINQFCSVLQNHMFMWENGPIVGSEAQTITLLMLRYHSRELPAEAPFSQALRTLVEKRGYMSRIFQVGAIEGYDPLADVDLEGLPELYVDDLRVAAAMVSAEPCTQPQLIPS
jgi:hypothetical protein